jgi:hypothetical protein
MVLLASGDRWAMKFDDAATGDGQGWRREFVGWRRALNARIPCAEEVLVLPPEPPWKCGITCVRHVVGVTGDIILNSNPAALPAGLHAVGEAFALWHRSKMIAPDEYFPPFDNHLASRESFARSFERRAVELTQAGILSTSLRARLIFFLDQNLARYSDEHLAPIHCDANIANMLFDRATGELNALLDFENLSVGPPRYDLAPVYGAMSCGYFTRKTFVGDPDWVFLWEGYNGKAEFTSENRLEITLYALDALLHAQFVPDYWYASFATLMLDGLKSQSSL